ncbi:MAG: hypothetical protein BGN82_11240 [Alphaproteobacteria bacterium 65-7]|nr:MAG: hypothetical protein BGN82_11240 [Alphaproteobacteria bacterium 65-7]
MKITKQVLVRRWALTTLLALAVFAVLFWSDTRLRGLSGFATMDLQSFTGAAQYRAAFFVWTPAAFAARAGFNLGLDYLFIPLYALAFFYSGILAREAFTPRPTRMRRLLTLLAAVPIAGGFLDAAENGLHLAMLLGDASDNLARIAFTLSSAKMSAAYVGLMLLVGAVMAQVWERKQRRLKAMTQD